MPPACITPESRSKLLHRSERVQSDWPALQGRARVCPARALATAVALFRANADERRGMAPGRGVRVSARTSLNAQSEGLMTARRYGGLLSPGHFPCGHCTCWTVSPVYPSMTARLPIG